MLSMRSLVYSLLTLVSAVDDCADFSGTFYCDTIPGCWGATVIAQEGCQVSLSNPVQQWSGVQGTIVGNTVTVSAWGGMTGMYEDGRISWTNSAIWVLSNPAPERCYVDPVFTAEELSVTKGVVYRSAFNPKLGKNETLTLDLYAPPVRSSEPRPAVVLIHGGSFVAGNSDSERLLSTALAQRGFLAATINYRLTGAYWGVEEYCCPGNLSDGYIHDAVADGEAAVQFVKSKAEEWNLDPDRVGIAGSSAGAVTVLHMGYNSSLAAEKQVRAVVPISGELRYVAFCKGVDASGEAYGCVTGTWDNRDAIDRDAEHLPLCLVHGTQDTVVPYTESVDMQKRAESKGINNQLITVEGGGHVPTRLLLSQQSEALMEFLWDAMSLAELSCPKRSSGGIVI